MKKPSVVRNRFVCIVILLTQISLSGAAQILFNDNFDDGNYSSWIADGTWSVQNGQLRGEANSNIFYGNYTDFVFEGDVSVSDLEKRSGLAFRATNLSSGDAFNGYFAFLRISTDRARVELERVSNGRVHLCDEMTLNIAVNTMCHMKVVCQGVNVWVFVNDMTTPAITEHDTMFSSGAIGFKTEEAFAMFDNAQVSSSIPFLARPLCTIGLLSKESYSSNLIA